MWRSSLVTTLTLCCATALSGQPPKLPPRVELPPLTNPVGRTVFLLDEPIRLHARLPDRKDGDEVTWRFTGDGGQKRSARSAVAGGRAGLLVEPLALGVGAWHASIDELPDAAFAFRVVHGVPNTPFVVNLYSGQVPDDNEQTFGRTTRWSSRPG